MSKNLLTPSIEIQTTILIVIGRNQLSVSRDQEGYYYVYGVIKPYKIRLNCACLSFICSRKNR